MMVAIFKHASSKRGSFSSCAAVVPFGIGMHDHRRTHPLRRHKRLHRGESGALFAIAPRPAHFDKTKYNADKHGHRSCHIRDCSQIHDDNLRRCEKMKSRRIISTLRLPIAN
jgi:hypothetical protein